MVGSYDLVSCTKAFLLQLFLPYTLLLLSFLAFFRLLELGSFLPCSLYSLVFLVELETSVAAIERLIVAFKCDESEGGTVVRLRAFGVHADRF